jgi:hypothetical protein
MRLQQTWVKERLNLMNPENLNMCNILANKHQISACRRSGRYHNFEFRLDCRQSGNVVNPEITG